MIKKTIVLFLFSQVIFTQSLSSLSGLYNIPSAEIVEDGKITIGTFYIPYKYAQEKNFDRDAIAYFGSFGFLPFIEMSLRFTKRLGPLYALGDRMFSFKLRFINEGKYFPAVAIGAQDFFHSTESRTNRYNSLYLTMTKNILFGKVFNSISLTGGYGSDMIKANGYEYIGIFGGISFKFFQHFEIMLENDARFYNFGTRIKLFDHIYLLGGFREMKYFSGGGGIYFNL